MIISNTIKKELQNYCKQNSYNYDKVMSFPRCGNDEVLFIQRVDRKIEEETLMDNKPAEALLTVIIKNGEVQIIKGENADKYFSIKAPLK